MLLLRGVSGFDPTCESDGSEAIPADFLRISSNHRIGSEPKTLIQTVVGSGVGSHKFSLIRSDPDRTEPNPINIYFLINI